MRSLSEVTINVKRGGFPELVSTIYKNGCSLQSCRLLEEDQGSETFVVEIAHSGREKFKRLLSFNSNRYRIVSVVDSREERISGGLMRSYVRYPIENTGDFFTGVIDAAELIQEKISEGAGRDFVGMTGNIGLISGIKGEGILEPGRLYALYAEAERDAVVINRFTNFNGVPVVIHFNHPEDLVQSLHRIDVNFAAIRLVALDDADLMLYSQICSELRVAVTSRMLDDIPVYLLALIMRMVKNFRLDREDTTVGFIGIDAGTQRLARLLLKTGFYRVLGSDQDEKLMLSFEREGGLATAQENIFGNADIIVLMKNNYDREHHQYIRPGQYIISMLKEFDVDREDMEARGIRQLVQCDETSLCSIYPGLVRGVLASGMEIIHDEVLVMLAERIMQGMSRDFVLPDVFSDIHDTISNALEAME